MSDSPGARPNVVLILADDLGFSDVGCFGGEIPTPNLDALAADGIRLTQFYNTARCSPSRASLLTGLHPHQTGVGILTRDDRPAGYPGTLNEQCATVAEVLGNAGYATHMAGKWHVSGRVSEPNGTWPTRRGFDRFYGTLDGGGSYFAPPTLMHGESSVDAPEDFYYTDAVAEFAADSITEHVRERPGQPFFSYVAFTAPHWPLHAPEAAIEQHAGRYDEGWTSAREARIERQRALNLFGDSDFVESDADARVPSWADDDDHGWQSRRMEVYAAQVALMDEGIGRILGAIEESGVAENTCVIFLSDNGGCAEEIVPGGGRLPFARTTAQGDPIAFGNTGDVWPGAVDTFASDGRAWANVSNAPFREYKHWVHEGGIATPFIVRWPSGIPETAAIRDRPHQLTDVMATFVDMSGARYPGERDAYPVAPMEGVSMLSTWRGEPETAERTLFWEHEGNAAVRRGRWKLVRKYPGPWELYDIDADRGERSNLALEERTVVAELSQAFTEWAVRVGVVPREVWEPLYTPAALGG